MKRLGAALLLALTARCATLVPPTRARELSLEEKIGQLFVHAARGVFMNEESAEYRALVDQVRRNHVGGILWSLSDVYETAHLNAKLQQIARVPLLLAADLEAGLGMRFDATTYWPWPMAVAATGDPALAERQGRIVAEEARAIGLNQIYAPVADVNFNPDNPVINVRSYGEDPEAVARFVAAFVRGAQSGGVIATVKHFPGHGDTRTDSHRSLPVLEVNRRRLDAVELVPFRAAIAAGVEAVMTAHMGIPALDPAAAPPSRAGARGYTDTGGDLEVSASPPLPASLSPVVTGDLLRRELGFRGLIVTDALDMGGITDHFDPGEAAVRAILAGADQVPKSPDIAAAIAGVRKAVDSGRIPMERIDASVERILAAKARFGAPMPDAGNVFRLVDRPAHRVLAEEIAQRSLTLLRLEDGALPLARDTRLLHLTVADRTEQTADVLERELAERLSEQPQTLRLHPGSTEEDLVTLLDGTARTDLVLLSLFVRSRSGQGEITLPPLAATAIAHLLARRTRVVAVSFGDPYILRKLPSLPTYLAAYGGQDVAQKAVARALFGEAGISGRLPVTIPGIAARGAGLQRAAVEAPAP